MTTIDVPSAMTPGSSGGFFSQHPISAIPDVYNLRLFAIRELRDYTSHMVGGILSVIDAMGLPDKQATAIRNLIFREVWDSRYAKALEWAEVEADLERREGIPEIGWNDIAAYRAMHPISPPEFNPFPFSTSTPTPIST